LISTLDAISRKLLYWEAPRRADRPLHLKTDGFVPDVPIMPSLGGSNLTSIQGCN
jgi:hypothetical protein